MTKRKRFNVEQTVFKMLLLASCTLMHLSSASQRGGPWAIHVCGGIGDFLGTLQQV